MIIMLLSGTARIQLASAQTAELQQLALDVKKLAQLKNILGDMKKFPTFASSSFSKQWNKKR